MTVWDQHKNLGYAVVTVGPGLAGTSLTVDTAALLPSAPFNATVWPDGVGAFQQNAEIVRVTDIVGNVLTIDRAQEGTSAKNIAAGFQLANTITVQDITDIEDAVNAIESGGVPPSGPAGGDLDGTYPDPELIFIASGQGPIGDNATVPVITTDDKGRIIVLGSVAIEDVPPAGPAGGDLDGQYPDPTLAVIGSAAGPTGDATHVPVVTIDAKGRVTALSSTPISGAAPGGAAGGVLSGTYPNPGFAVDMATQAELDALAAAAVLDGDAAGGVLAGTFPNPSFAVDMATQAELDAVASAAAVATAAALARAATLNVIEKDLGTVPLYSGSFQITGLAGLTADKVVSVQQAPGPYTGKGTLADEAEMDMVTATGFVLSATVIQVFWNALVGPLMGNVKFSYLVSV